MGKKLRFRDLLSVESDPKTVKNAGEYLVAIQYLAPANTVRGANLCPHASPGCMGTCLFTAGMAGIFPTINRARIARTKLFLESRHAYMQRLRMELMRFLEKCARRGKKPAVRLNGTSDIVWEKIAPDLFTQFHDVQFYDYTKIGARMSRVLPRNYHLTFSRSELNEEFCLALLRTRTAAVTAVFDHKRVKRHGYPKLYKGYPVVNGDESDLRFTDPAGCWIGLKAKGRARKDKTGFVIREF